MGLAKKVAFNTLVQYSGRIICALIGLCTVMFLTRYLGVKGFGQYTTIFAYITIFGVIAEFGFYFILVREISREGANVSQIVSNIFTLKSLFSFSILSLAALSVLFLPYEPVIKKGILILAAATFWLALNSVFTGVFQANYRMDKPVLTEVTGRVIILGFIILAVYLKYSLLFIVSATLIGYIVNLLLSFYLVRRYVHISFRFDFEFWRKIWKEILPMGIITILGLIYFKIDIVILSLLKPSLDVGIYGPPFKILEILMAFPAIFMGVVFPALSFALSKDKERASVLFQKSYDILSISAWPLFFGIFILAMPIMNFIAGSEYAATSTVTIRGLAFTSATTLQILILVIFLSFFNNLYYSTIVASGLQRALILPNITCVIFNIGINLLLIPKFSYIAAASIAVFTQALSLIFCIIILSRSLRFKVNLSIFLKGFLAALLMGIILWLKRDLNLFVLIILGAGVYLTVLYLLRGFSKQMILSIIKG